MKQIKKKKNGRFAKIRKWLNIIIWCGFLVVMLIVVGIFVAISKGRIGYVPPIEQLENPIDRYASQILSEDGVLLGSFSFSEDNRIYVKYDDLSPHLVNALIAAEDNRFVKHSGIDIKGLVRAIIKRGVLMQQSGGGGSTITQQLAKQLFSPKAGNITERILQKPIEWVIAIRLEKYYTKEEIINLYLNKFDFLYNAVGIQSASKSYFNTIPKNLKVEEAATLIGMCKNPSYYNPRRFNERAQGRRNTVLRQMSKYGYLDSSACDSLCQLPLELNFSRTDDHKEGIAPYFRQYLRMVMTASMPERRNYISEQKFREDSVAWETNPLFGWCNKEVKANGNHYSIYTDGLKIHTTLNSRMQQYAEEAVSEHVGKRLQPDFFRQKRGRRFAPFTFSDMSDSEREIRVNEIMERAVRQSDRYRAMKAAGESDEEIMRVFKEKTEMSVFSWNGTIDTVLSPIDSIRYLKTFLRSGFMAMDAKTGYVKAYVGGIDFANFQYDMVTTGRRQIGSTMKPFVYSLAMSEGFTPCYSLLHVQPHIPLDDGTFWEPRNSTSERIGESVTLQWGLQKSSNWVTASLMSQLSPDALERLLRSYGFMGFIEPRIAMCLGTPDISIAEMVSAYTVFVNKGVRIDPIYVSHIEDAFGNTVATFNVQPHEVLSDDATYKILNILQSVVDAGTAASLRSTYGLRAPMGGKTGTTQNQSDGWYMGLTPSLVAGCWVGGEDRSIHFDTMEGQGARVALPIYGLFMRKVYADKALGYSDSEKFDIPEEYKDPCYVRTAPPRQRPASGDEFF